MVVDVLVVGYHDEWHDPSSRTRQAVYRLSIDGNWPENSLFVDSWSIDGL